jgi:hypothetical protein
MGENGLSVFCGEKYGDCKDGDLLGLLVLPSGDDSIRNIASTDPKVAVLTGP